MSYGLKKNKIYALVTSLVIMVAATIIFTSCAGKSTTNSEDKNKASSEYQGKDLKEISLIKVDNSDPGSTITIQSNERLTYSIKKNENNKSLEIFLPKTKISDDIDRELISNGFANKINSENLNEDRSAKILISTTNDFDHSISRESDTVIKISLRNKILSGKIETSDLIADRLISINSQNTESGLKINLIGNGKITNYKKSVIAKPNPRIVFDIYNISSDAKKEKKISINSTLADSVRYYNYSDYVRVVIDTKADYLKSFNEFSTSNGLSIDIGRTGIGASASNSEVMQSAGSSRVEKIDLVTDSAGKSTLQIRTSSPAKYDVYPSSGNKIEISIKNSSISQSQQKPIISSRFDSSVEKITTAQSDSNATVNVLMRDKAPYRVDQNGNTISVHFEKAVISASNNTVKPNNSLKVPASSSTSYKAISRTIAPAGKINEASLASFSINNPANMNQQDYDIGNVKKKYIGEKIALDFFETDIRNVFRIIQTVSKKNFAIDTDVKGRVTMRMDEPVPWDQVLDLVLKMNSLGMVQEGEIVRISTLDRLKREEDMKREVLKARIEKEDQQKASDPIYTEYITVNYSNAKNEVLPHLKSIITPKRGTVSVDERNNQVIITDTKAIIAKSKEIIKSIDKVTPQVIIEARVVEATDSVSREIGTKWNASDDVGVTGKDDTIFKYDIGATNLPANASGFVGLNFTRIAGNSMILNARLEAFESTGEIKIISSPKILTLDNKEAKIEQGVEYPYLKEIDEDGKATYELKPLTLTLTVKPHVTPDNRIAMTINIKKDDIGDEIVQATSGITGQTKTFARSFLKKEATTELLVDDGETVVIGGIVKTRTEDSSQSVPYLSKIPVLGWLFKSKISDNERSELLLFITPRIVQLEQKN